MFIQDHRRWRLMLAILSLSLLTVMAGAAVAPALDVIQQHFSGEPVILIQLIISMPALFIAITNLFFGKLCALFKGRTLTLTGLIFYVVFGCAAGLCSNIYLLLICRALVGVGVGIIMPMSTGLITYYFTRDKQDTLMGYSSAMNMMGGVVATLIAGFLGGLLFPKCKTAMGNRSKYIAPVLFILGYIALQSASGLLLTLIGSFMVGAANGIGVPYFISTASAKAGANAATTVIPALSIALYIAQFTAPTIITAIQAGLGSVSGAVTSYEAAILLSVVMLLWVGVFDRKKN